MGERLSTGLAGLDAQLGGGVPPGTVHVLIGEPMNAMELFGYHFAAGGTVGQGGTVFVATESTEEEVRNGVRTVGGRPERLKVVTLNPQETELPPVHKGARYILDTFSGYMGGTGWDAAFPRLATLKAQTRAAGTATLVTVVDGLHDAGQRTRLKVWADGVMELGFDRQGFGLYPYLKVTKMRGVPDSARFLLFKETEKGLFMESTRRVF